MKLRSMILAVLVLWANAACGQSTLMLPIQANSILPDGVQLISAAASNTYASAMQVDQLVIPRYRSGSNYPAGQCCAALQNQHVRSASKPTGLIGVVKVTFVHNLRFALYQVCG